MVLRFAVSVPLRAGVLHLSVAVAAASAPLLPPVLGAVQPKPVVEAQGGGLLLSEVMTGGASASDEFIELYNPTATEIALDDLELVYVTATGATTSRRAAWDAGAPSVAPRGHLLVAHAGGIHADGADATYESGMASAGGSVVLREQGAAVAIDAVSWGTAASAWLEGSPAPAPAAGWSLERLPGGSLGSGQDSGDNLGDFVVRATPDPQSSTDPPIAPPTSEPPPTPSAPATPPTSTAAPTAVPSPPSMTVADARRLGDGDRATVTATALTGASFTEGGGYVADHSGGIAVLVEGGSFERGQLLVLTGEVDDRFHQRTLRVDGQPQVIGPGSEPDPIAAATGAIGEPLEGRLVSVAGRIAGAPTALSGGSAFAVDDGSGDARVVVGSATGIATDGWVSGAMVSVVGVVGQRDSSGGSGGYRVQPRDAGDVIAVAPPPTPAPTASPSAAPPGSASPVPSAAAGGAVVSIAEARRRPTGDVVRVRGVVTLPDNLVEEGSAVLEDSSAAIELRLGEDAGSLGRGELLEVVGTRSTNAGMQTIRLSGPPARLGRSPEPPATHLSTGAAGEEYEAALVIVRGALVASPRRASSGTVSFDTDDGSGPLRVVVADGTGAESQARDLETGTWVEVRGVLGQQTTGAEPNAGYRLWPRDGDDLTVLSATAGAGIVDGFGTTGASDADILDGRSAGRSSALSEIDDSIAAALAATSGSGPRRLEATLVAGVWPQLAVAGVLWDGRHAAAIVDDAHARAAIGALLADGATPVVVRLTIDGAAGVDATSGVPLLRLAPGERVEPTTARPASPAREPPDAGPPHWVRVTGHFSRDGAAGVLTRPSGTLRVELACETSQVTALTSGETLALQGLATAVPSRLFVGCDGVRRAPALVLASERSSAAWAPPTPAPDRPGDEPRPDSGFVAPIAVAATVIALVVIGSVGAVLLRRALDGASATGAEREAPGSLPADARPDGADDDDPPQLTLVRLPPDRGSR